MTVAGVLAEAGAGQTGSTMKTGKAGSSSGSGASSGSGPDSGSAKRGSGTDQAGDTAASVPLAITLTEDFPDLRRWSERYPLGAAALRVGGLVFVGVTLVKSDQRSAWPLAAVAITAGMVWSIATAREHAVAIPAAIVFGLSGAVMAGTGRGEPAGLTFMFLCVLYLQAVAEPRVVAVYTAVALLAIGTASALLSDRAADLSWIAGMTFGATCSATPADHGCWPCSVHTTCWQ
ncbi:hypothetical protein ACFQ9X_18595 [Catenulispora yoronensis]